MNQHKRGSPVEILRPQNCAHNPADLYPIDSPNVRLEACNSSYLSCDRTLPSGLWTKVVVPLAGVIACLR